MEVRAVTVDSPSVFSADTTAKKPTKEESALRSIEALNDEGDSVGTSINDLPKSLAITAKEIVDKINEKLGIALPGGIQSLKPEDVTPEATAARIVQGVVGFYDIFAKQNPNLASGELLNKFLETVKGGIDEGYADAISILEGLNAFQFDGVREGVEKTRTLIDEKLEAFRKAKLEEYGFGVEATDSSDGKEPTTAPAAEEEVNPGTQES
ncbi:MAG: DUF5610 domain-containing protein [Deltaproteobacteria bacterium]|nr:DUF5610 domain-containing protein [Deltaproteobacteria bacterium]